MTATVSPYAIQIADNLRIQEARLEGAMRSIRDLGGATAVVNCTQRCLQRVVREANDNKPTDWIA